MSTIQGLSAPPAPPSTHTAFVYAFLAPGTGEQYAGARARGALTLVAVLGVFSWFCYAFYRLALETVELATSYLQKHALPADVAGASWGMQALIGLGVALLLWKWGMISAVGVARSRREALGAPEQANPLWAGAMSFLCPGLGQAYVGKPLLGWCFLALNLGALVLLGRSYADLAVQAGPTLAHNLPRFSEDLLAALAAFEPFLIRAKLSPAGALRAATEHAALLLAVDDVRRNVGYGLENLWLRSGFAAGVALCLLGLLAPGGAQMLQRRRVAAWLLCFLCLGIELVAALAYDQARIDDATAQSLLVWPRTLLWIGVGEALARRIFFNASAPLEIST